MSLRRNIVASYVSQTYAALIGIMMVPVYIRYMGSEAYGLVGFYAMLQAWFQLLDMGMAPTLSRETARYLGGAIDGLLLRRLLRALEGVFFAVALVGGLGLGLGADWLSSSWLQSAQLPADQVRTAIVLMAGVIAMRWVAGLYRAAVVGFEQQVWLARLNVSISTARFVFVVPVFLFVGATPADFFTYQLLVAVVETGLLMRYTYRLLPPVPAGARIGLDLEPVRGVLRFSLSIAFTGAVWVATTQSDKLMLSRLLPLAEYGQYMLAVVVASGVSVVSAPLSSVLQPRLSRLHAAGDDQGLLLLYRKATQAMALVVAPVSLVLSCGAEPLIFAWTGDAALAVATAPILSLYALGNGVLALAAFPYYLQIAKGDVHLHVIGNVLFMLLLVPSIWLATRFHGALGAGWAWVAVNLVYVLLWVPLVHRRFAPGLHVRWLLRDVMAIVGTAGLAAALLVQWIDWPASRIMAMLTLLMFGITTLGFAALGSSQTHTILARAWLRGQR